MNNLANWSFLAIRGQFQLIEWPIELKRQSALHLTWGKTNESTTSLYSTFVWPKQSKNSYFFQSHFPLSSPVVASFNARGKNPWSLFRHFSHLWRPSLFHLWCFPFRLMKRKVISGACCFPATEELASSFA